MRAEKKADRRSVKILKNMHGRIFVLSCMLSILSVTGQITTVDVFAATEEECGDFLITGGTLGVDYTFEDGVLQVRTETPIVIRNADPAAATTNRIAVTDGEGEADITLAGVNIDVSSLLDDSNGRAAFQIADNRTGDVTIRLADGTENMLKSGRNRAGLEKNGEDAAGTLTISGNTGILQVEGGLYGAGIGGAKLEAGRSIAIDGGIIKAVGGDEGAGIGGGSEGDGFYITINGGTITATGGGKGAGIGGGTHGLGRVISINGGDVTAIGGVRAAGIGGGYDKTGVNIIIHDGDIKARGTAGGAGIGGGYGGAGRGIIIHGGTVTATGFIGKYGDSCLASDESGAGIGGGCYGAGNRIMISGGDITAMGGIYAAGIGGGRKMDGYDLTIEEGSITAVGGNYAAGIGGGMGGVGGNIVILGGSIAASAREEATNDIGNGAGANPSRGGSLIVEGDVATVKGRIRPQMDLTIDNNITLTIEKGAILIVEDKTVLTNNGIIYNQGTISILGTISNRGTLEDQGEIANRGKLEGNDVIHESVSAEPVEQDDAKQDIEQDVMERQDIEQDVTEPETGDKSMLWLYTILAVMAGMGIYMMALPERKEKGSR
ncbi:MAG: hypothetical protein J1E61_04920 [Lachnospiraceae bacterium]|nr:hypothetical protein [Lachnospiraceae bacterium]